MSELLTSGGIFAFVLGLMLFEALVLVVYHQRTGAGIAPFDLIINFLSGIGLLLAIGAVLLKSPPAYIALFLAVSLLSHVTDLRRRWRHEP